MFKYMGASLDLNWLFSDNGGSSMGGSACNYPLRGQKMALWEGGIRAVGFVSGPVMPRHGETSHDLLHVSDWFPTLVRLAGGSTEGMELDGHDVWDTLRFVAVSCDT